MLKPWGWAVLSVALLLDLLLAGAAYSVAGFATEGGRGNRVTPEVVLAVAVPTLFAACAVVSPVLMSRKLVRAGFVVAFVPVTVFVLALPLML